MADQEAERIKYETEVLRLITLLGVGGGALSLALGDVTLLRTGLAAAGILITLVLLIGGLRQHRYIRMLIERL